MSRKLQAKMLVVTAACGLAASCVSRDPPLISSREPDRLVPAIKTAARTGDKRAIPYMVANLESDDAAVRMYAIDGLRRLTGEDLGYVYYADCDARKPAVVRWKAWLTEHPE